MALSSSDPSFPRRTRPRRCHLGPLNKHDPSMLFFFAIYMIRVGLDKAQPPIHGPYPQSCGPLARATMQTRTAGTSRKLALYHTVHSTSELPYS